MSLDKNFVDRLSDEHKEQLQKYIRFYNMKTQKHCKEITQTFEETKEMRVLDDMYSQDDVIQIIDSLRDVILQEISEEHRISCQQATLYLSQMFLQAEGHKAALNIDTATLEDALLLAGVKKLDIDLDRKNTLDNLPNPGVGGKKLASISGAADVNLVTRCKELEEHNRSLQHRYEQLEKQAKQALKENTELLNTKEELTARVADAKKDLDVVKSNNSAAHITELEKLRAEFFALKTSSDAKIKELTAEVKAAQDSLQDKVNNSLQFQQLKKLVIQKNTQIKDARAKITELEAKTEAK